MICFWHLLMLMIFEIFLWYHILLIFLDFFHISNPETQKTCNCPNKPKKLNLFRSGDWGSPAPLDPEHPDLKNLSFFDLLGQLQVSYGFSSKNERKLWQLQVSCGFAFKNQRNFGQLQVSYGFTSKMVLG